MITRITTNKVTEQSPLFGVDRQLRFIGVLNVAYPPFVRGSMKVAEVIISDLVF